MSHLTFNIDDYRPIAGARIRSVRDRSQSPKRSSGFLVMPGSQNHRTALAPEPAVVDIRDVDIRNVLDMQSWRRGTGAGCVYKRRGKILCFTAAEPSRVEVLSMPHPGNSVSPDPEPSDLPPAA